MDVGEGAVMERASDMTGPDGAAPSPDGGRPAGTGADRPDDDAGESSFVFDRHLVLDQLGGWRGMVDATVPTIAFIVANGIAGLRPGIWAALGAAVLIFGLRLTRRESVQQAVSGLFAVGVAVAIAAATGQARDFYVPGIIRNAALAVVLLGSIVVRRPLVGVIAEFLAPSHLGAMSTPGAALPRLRGRVDPVVLDPPGAAAPATGRGLPDPPPERPWREDPRLLRAYGWLTVLWAAVFLVRAAVQGYLYLGSENTDATDLGVVSLLLGVPVTAVEILVTLWVVSRLHRHRSVIDPAPPEPDERPSA
ncbi:DUF3159 domain-containing protein [Blastococcus goldschmidtiae]|uniref:DUF3159 domain-containing protein n=1 Tax=Blastococcus goldschmidtiae TaxID=3075546 RepID=A0ABU2KCP9_9ACTN|nr:DUF3159 domain-containing protein [Blastococcus sp. DSM 46792]MDT0277968.1 DUF3159 domain-containing protein [Blastococcus sp. DSM 46792]